MPPPAADGLRPVPARLPTGASQAGPYTATCKAAPRPQRWLGKPATSLRRRRALHSAARPWHWQALRYRVRVCESSHPLSGRSLRVVVEPRPVPHVDPLRAPRGQNTSAAFHGADVGPRRRPTSSCAVPPDLPTPHPSRSLPPCMCRGTAAHRQLLVDLARLLQLLQRTGAGRGGGRVVRTAR